MFLYLFQDIPAVSLKKIYTDFYHRLVEAVSDEHTCQSLLTQLSSSALISEKKIAQLSVVTGSSFLKTLGLEEEPHLLVPLVSAMSQVEQLQTLAGEMTAQLKQGTYIHMHTRLFFLMQFILTCVGIAQYVGKPQQFEATGAIMIMLFCSLFFDSFLCYEISLLCKVYLQNNVYCLTILQALLLSNCLFKQSHVL